MKHLKTKGLIKPIPKCQQPQIFPTLYYVSLLTFGPRYLKLIFHD